VIDTPPNLVTGGALERGWFGVLLTLFWFVGIIIAVNLLDGLDGLAAGTSLITFGSLAAAFSVTGATSYLPLILVLSGALLGFLFYNFNPASIFMGDCGSTFLGFLLATYSIQGPHQTNSLLAFLIPILALGLPVLDTALSLIRRFLEQRSLFRPDQDHIHHRIARRFGLTHRMTVLVLYGVSLKFGVLAFSVTIVSDTLRTFVLTAAAFVIYLFLRSLGYFRLRDLPWLIQEREEFGKIRRFVEQEGGDAEGLPLNGDEEELWVDDAAEVPVGKETR
jgi:UDP-GlcNAc:undecaprenyl-phosphate GlcNAc-1-phosphate transferase